jgi:hypothetical protein
MDNGRACNVTAIPRRDAHFLVVEGLLSCDPWLKTACRAAPVPKKDYAWQGKGKCRLGLMEGRIALQYLDHPCCLVERIRGKPPVGVAVEVDGGLAGGKSNPAFESLVHGKVSEHHRQGLGVPVKLPIDAGEIILFSTPPLLCALATLDRELLTASVDARLPVGGRARRRCN